MSDLNRYKLGDKIVDRNSDFKDLIYNSDEVTPVLIETTIEDRVAKLEDTVQLLVDFIAKSGPTNGCFNGSEWVKNLDSLKKIIKIHGVEK